MLSPRHVMLCQVLLSFSLHECKDGAMEGGETLGELAKLSAKIPLLSAVQCPGIIELDAM